jgi:cell wall-associated NlpC family hydrolase
MQRRPAPTTPSPGRRPLLLGLAAVAALGLGGCGTGPRAPAPAEARRPPPSERQAQRNDVALAALALLDTAYARGGRGPATGFDCSGLVSHVFEQALGLRLRGTAADLGRLSRPIEAQALRPGDLVFFNTLGARHSHVGVYVGDGRFVHASNPRTGVRVDRLSNRYYAQRFEGAHTVLD